MELHEALRRRRMVRAFRDAPVPVEAVDRLLDAGRRAPSAGWAQGLEWVVLEGSEQTERFWRCTFPEGRERFRWQGLFRAPVLLVPLADPGRYLDRYAEPDKSATGLHDPARWPVPYWHVDAGMAVMAVLLAAVDEALGALFFGIFRGERALRAELGIPDRLTLVGALAVGWPAPDEPGRSAGRGRRPAHEVVHRGGFS